eukprot:CAMPEP_0177196018 /NCGR_PEP_ID=MMETSP0367-20130122/23823_1 /TAXON_ID=447022 ORGANISM="Scrippsiella hangoei-like, Strain SHHI-4" /NCGR_SAMPLE_ID=MMETSP0367 /ASSEMBLY_ACC=CAM_ASM_000362 /LENGTH=350 /DNA_ID=CAMNT_0018644085 /DNA_START=114 /DNA_END=1166 /DNA_ORIENTATION=-
MSWPWPICATSTPTQSATKLPSTPTSHKAATTHAAPREPAMFAMTANDEKFIAGSVTKTAKARPPLAPDFRRATARGTAACSQNCKGSANRITAARPLTPPSAAASASPPGGRIATRAEVAMNPSSTAGPTSSKVVVIASRKPLPIRAGKLQSSTRKARGREWREWEIGVTRPEMMAAMAAAIILAVAAAGPKTPTVKSRESMPADCAATMKATTAGPAAPELAKPADRGSVPQLHKGLASPSSAPLAVTAKPWPERWRWMLVVDGPRACAVLVQRRPSNNQGHASTMEFTSSAEKISRWPGGGFLIKGRSQTPSSSSSHFSGCRATGSGIHSVGASPPTAAAALAQQLS